jgi:competence protein ComEC
MLFLFGLRERHLQPWLAYALALLAVLVVQPLAAMQTGFWLSFITVGALLLAFAGRLGGLRGSQLLWLPQLVVGVALWCPLLLAGQAQAPLAPLVNALAIPLADLVVVPAALAGCLLLASWAMPSPGRC